MKQLLIALGLIFFHQAVPAAPAKPPAYSHKLVLSSYRVGTDPQIDLPN